MNKTPTITIYGNRNGAIVQKFLNAGQAPLIDAVNGGNFVFLSKNYCGPHRFYCVEENGYITEYDTPEVEPDFCIAFNVGVEVVDWHDVMVWLRGLLFEDGGKENLLPRPIHQKAAIDIHENGDDNDEKTNYEFKFEIVNDVIFYEVWKPNTDRPYTVVIDKYSEVGHEPFFSSLFVCDSWGVATSDYIFLKRLWEFLEMKSEYDLEKMVKTHSEECKNGKNEPRIYRKNLENVVKMFTDIGSKRKFHMDERRPKMLILK